MCSDGHFTYPPPTPEQDYTTEKQLQQKYKNIPFSAFHMDYFKQKKSFQSAGKWGMCPCMADKTSFFVNYIVIMITDSSIV